MRSQRGGDSEGAESEGREQCSLRLRTVRRWADRACAGDCRWQVGRIEAGWLDRDYIGLTAGNVGGVKPPRLLITSGIAEFYWHLIANSQWKAQANSQSKSHAKWS